jgi:hypothetical protein
VRRTDGECRENRRRRRRRRREGGATKWARKRIGVLRARKIDRQGWKERKKRCQRQQDKGGRTGSGSKSSQ